MVLLSLICMLFGRKGTVLPKNSTEADKFSPSNQILEERHCYPPNLRDYRYNEGKHWYTGSSGHTALRSF